MIKVDLLFKYRRQIIFITLYNPNDEKETTMEINDKLDSCIQEASISDMDTIILSDFNEADKARNLLLEI